MQHLHLTEGHERTGNAREGNVNVVGVEADDDAHDQCHKDAVLVIQEDRDHDRDRRQRDQKIDQLVGRLHRPDLDRRDDREKDHDDGHGNEHERRIALPILTRLLARAPF